MLKLQFKDKRRPSFWAMEKLYSIGSAADNNLVVNDNGIDPLHARLISDGDKIFLKDNNSRSGCFINGQRITHKEVVPGDVIRLGTTELEVLDPRTQQAADHTNEDTANHWRLVSNSNWLAGQTFFIASDRPTVIGRGVESDIVIPGTHLARRHTELTALGKSLQVKDLGSANGTFINDHQVDNTIARSGDRLRIDVYTFLLLGPEADKDSRSRIRAPIESLARPIERKQTSSEPKHWKTRPTSPGNRIESPSISPYRKSGLWFWLILVALVAALIISIYLL